MMQTSVTAKLLEMKRIVYGKNGIVLGSIEIVHQNNEFKGTFILNKNGLNAIVKTFIKDETVQQLLEDNYEWLSIVEITNNRYFPLTKSVYMADIPVDQQRAVAIVLDYIDRLVQHVFEYCIQEEWEH